MTTRRNFLKGAAAGGIVFCSCGLLDHARAQQDQPRTQKLPVKVRGKRVAARVVPTPFYKRPR